MYCTGTKRVAMSIQYEYAFQPLDALESMRRMNGIVCNPDSRCYLVLICLTIPHASEPCSKFNDPPIYIYECTHSMSTVRSINPPFAFFLFFFVYSQTGPLLCSLFYLRDSFQAYHISYRRFEPRGQSLRLNFVTLPSISISTTATCSCLT